MFSLRVVTTDHYLQRPSDDFDLTYSDFRLTAIYKVPIFRIFGVTPAGQKCCMHVHGIFPYLYIPYDGTEPIDPYLKQLACSIDKALNIAAGKAASNQTHVFKILLVSGL